MTKDRTAIRDLLESCKRGGGRGAIIFHAFSDSNIESWSTNGLAIAAVAVQRDVGVELLKKLGEAVTLAFGDGVDLEYTMSVKSGTSMATPHVAGAAALLWSHFSECSNHQIRFALASTAKHPDRGCDENYGYGIIKVKDAYKWLSSRNCTGWDVPHVSQGGCSTL